MYRSAGSSLLARLGEISGQLQEFIHKIAESRKCSLQSLELELHLGDLKVRYVHNYVCRGRSNQGKKSLCPPDMMLAVIER